MLTNFAQCDMIEKEETETSREVKEVKKAVLVINGVGGVGKDTLCDLAAKHFRVKNISSITPIKEIAAMCGWDGAKDQKGRKFLSDLKLLCVEYNDYPTVWLMRQYHAFLAGDDEIMFVHIREPQEIEKFVRATDGAAKTLLIRGGDRFPQEQHRYGNSADDGVENYRYDYYFMNDGSLDEAERRFTDLLSVILSHGKT